MLLLGSAPVLLSRQGSSYLLDSAAGQAGAAAATPAALSAVVTKDFVPTARPAKFGPTSVGLRSVSGEDQPENDGKQMSSAEFTAHLQAYGVDTAEFGRGDAKTLEEFYHEVIVDEESYLIV